MRDNFINPLFHGVENTGGWCEISSLLRDIALAY